MAEEADVELFAFVDDLHVVGAPTEVMKALAALQQKLPDLKLRCNNAKSCMAYFHHDDEPLPAAIRHSLADQDIATRLDWVEVMGVGAFVLALGGCQLNRSHARIMSTAGASPLHVAAPS